jgi:phosphocarrier protein FPr
MSQATLPPVQPSAPAEAFEPPAGPQLRFLAPLSGQVWPLERVPDPVFAQKMVGDGVSIDPSDSLLLAACDGEVIALHAAGHAVTLRTAQGIELLMHIGIDTVNLKGEGFRPRVKIGDRVRTRTPLIEFDLDFVATRAKSALTQIVIANSDRVGSWDRASGGLVAAGKDTIFTVVVGGDNGAAVAAEAGESVKTVTSGAIIIPNRAGLHARPAAVLATLARSFKSAVKLQLGEQQANARSVTAILAMEVLHGASVRVIASGPDAAAAVEKLSAVLAEGCGDEGCAPAPAPATMTIPPAAAPPPPRRKSTDPNLLLGVAASPGLAVGQVFQIRRAEIQVSEAGEGVDIERRRLAGAIAAAQGQLSALRAQLHAKSEPAKAAIFAAHEELLADPDLLEVVESAIAKGKSAAFAWKKAVTTHADRLAALRNQLLAQRANDLRDVGLRVLAELTGADIRQPEYPPDAVLIAEDLTPSDTAALDRSRVMGFCTTRGGATSHVAILARSLGIPALAGIEPAALELVNGALVILDGSKGTLRTNATPEQVARIRRAQERAEQRRKADLARAHEPAVTLDGKRIEVFANIGGVKDAAQVGELGGEGVGLLRSEFLFMERADAPTEEEQFQTYKSIILALGPDRPLIIRTLDVGGDKPLSYLPIPREDNPFLGERGVRVGLDRPEILRTQVRAILRAAASGGDKVRVMFPMIATIGELRDVKAILVEEAANLGVRSVPAGIMVEVPAAAIMAQQFAREADFFSIGTNDLTQYTLAMDRGHPKLAPQVDGLSPAVLKLIAHTVNGARAAAAADGRTVHVGICGGIASDPSAVPILLGIGVDELSVSLPAIPAVKAQIRSLRLEECRQLADRALAADSAADVRALVPDPDEAET